MSDLDSARALLKAPASGGTSVWGHLSSVLESLVKERPRDALQTFEALSASIKAQKKQAQAAASSSPAADSPQPGIVGKDIPAPALVSDAALKSSVQAYLQKTQDSIKKPKKVNEDGEEEEEEEVEINPAAPDLVQQHYFLKEAGENTLMHTRALIRCSHAHSTFGSLRQRQGRVQLGICPPRHCKFHIPSPVQAYSLIRMAHKPVCSLFLSCVCFLCPLLCLCGVV